MARPTKYKPEYCDLVVEHMAEGASLTSFAASIDVCRNTIDTWREAHPEFLGACMRAQAKCAQWWEKTNRMNAATGRGNATSCIFGLSNMAPQDFKQKQTHEVSGPGGGPVEWNLQPVKASGKD